MIPVYIGYDPREAAAFHVCAQSIIARASEPVSIIPLALNALAKVYQETHTDGSNQFIYSRFLVPYLQGFSGHALFLDGDMIVQDDIAKLWARKSPYHAVQCVPHDYQTRFPIKYWGAKNADYPRKNWSSVVIWNCGSFLNRKLTPEYVRQQTGAYLHRFAWLNDESVGALPLEWNWLVREYADNPEAKLLHYTLGTPCIKGYESPEWFAELRKALNVEGQEPMELIAQC